MMMPKLFSLLKNNRKEFTKKQITQDIVAGIIVAIIALPLSIALAIASGVSPEKGLLTAIIGGFIISFLGGSRVQIGGPTGAFVIIIYGIIQKYSFEGLMVATIMAGIILIIFGLVKFGSVIKFIPYSITTGFTAGIAIVLFSTQIKDFLGLGMEEVPTEFFEKWGAYISNISSFQIETIIIGVIALLIIILVPKLHKKIPGALVALVVTTLLVQLMNLPVETIGSRFGEVSASIPMPKIPNISFEMISDLIIPAITIAILAGIESLLSAVVADGMIGKKHNSNIELVAQGVANIASALFGGIPVTGAIARTAANVKNGGRTPIAGIVHSVFLLLIMVLLMPYAKLIPMTTLAAILIVISYNMSEWRAFKDLFKSTKSDVAVLLITFSLTVIFDLVLAIEIGMILAMFLFIKKSSEATNIKKVDYLYDSSEESGDENDSNEDSEKLAGKFDENKKIMVYEINGPLFFGAAHTFMDLMDEIDIEAKVLVIKMKSVLVFDATALNVLKRIKAQCKKHKIKLIFTEVQESPMKLMLKSGFVESVGKWCFFDNLEDGYEKAKALLTEEF
ncbi:MAG: sulfate permease SulP family [Fusobacteria bacterium]|nr:MAG: sulfate permease SulP family [Fusobacteriota bacterium]KAF0230152.1 MAG: sulfate permease SulP [Fusobacteriota bacterium]